MIVNKIYLEQLVFRPNALNFFLDARLAIKFI